MTRQEAKEKYTSFVIELEEAYPGVKLIMCEFSGAGDSFDSFFNTQLRGSKNEYIDSSDHWRDRIENELRFIWWEVIERLGAGFDGDGSIGEITIDLSTGKVESTFSWYEQTTVPGDNMVDQQLSELFPE